MDKQIQNKLKRLLQNYKYLQAGLPEYFLEFYNIISFMLLNVMDTKSDESYSKF